MGNPREGPSPDSWLSPEDDATADQIDVLDPLPSEWWEKYEARSEEFAANGQPKKGRE